MFSTTARFVRAHLEFGIPWDRTRVFLQFQRRDVTLCFKLRSFYIDFCCFLSISNVTVMNIRFCVSTVSAFFSNLIAMATLF